MGCFPFLAGDAVDRQLKEAEELKKRDRNRINKEIEKGNILLWGLLNFNRALIKQMPIFH